MNGGFIRLDESWIGKTVLYGNQTAIKGCHCETCTCIDYKLELVEAKIISYKNSGSILYPSMVSLKFSEEINVGGKYYSSELNHISEACWKCHAAYHWIHPDCK